MTEYSNSSNINITGTMKVQNGTTEVTVVRENFEKDVVTVLDTLWKSGTGKAVIKNTAAMVFIQPRPGTPNPKVLVGAEAHPMGAVVKISFEPDAWPTEKNQLGAGEVLLHELVHAVRGLVGKADANPTGDAYKDLEEFYAIVVSNIYRSELGKIGLRGGHGGESLPANQRDNAAVFLNTGQNRKRLERLQREMPEFFRDVGAAVMAKWNPIRLMTHPAKK